MAVSWMEICCFLTVCLFIQSASLYTISPSDDDHSDLSSFNKDYEKNLLILGNNDDDDDDLNTDRLSPWLLKSKRSPLILGLHPTPVRRNNRPHWNPLIAAYKRCADLTTSEERENCFKDAVQMLFLYKL